jgi:hypothetical protein
MWDLDLKMNIEYMKQVLFVVGIICKREGEMRR